MPESLKIREDRPVASEMHAELEALRLRSEALTSPSQTDLKAMQDDRNFQVWPMVAATLGIVAAILGGYEFGLSGKLEHLGVWEKIVSIAIGALAAATTTFLALRKAKILSGHTVAARNELSAAAATLHLQSAALTAAANSVIVTDRNGTIEWVNPAFTSLSGYSFAEAVGKNPRDLVKSGKQDRAVYKILWKTILAGRVWHGELINRRKDGSLYTEIQTITPLRGASGEIAHFIAIKQDVTELRNSRLEIIALNDLLRQAVDNSPAVLYTLKFDGNGVRPIFVSDNVERLLGVEVKDASADWWRDSLHPDERDSVMAIRANVTKGDGYSIEYRIRHKSGAYKWVHDISRVRRDSSGLATELTGAWIDVTEQHQADEKLRLFRALMDQSMDSIEVIEAESGRCLDVSENALAERGYSRAEFLSLRVFDLDPNQKEADWPRHMESIRAAGSLRGEGLHRRKDGTTFPVEYSAKWVRLDRDYIVAVVRDISLRKLAEETLRASEERYRLFFESSPLAMWLYDLETLRFMKVNDAAVRLYGYSKEEFLAMTIKDIRPAEDVLALLKSAREGWAESQSSSEWRHRRKDGTIIDVEVNSRPLVLSGRESRLVLANDITEKKLIERKFLEAQRLESIGMLASGIAHDLNNVLAPIMFGVPMLRQRLSAPEDLKILETIGKCCERGAGLVRQILGFMRSATGDFLPIQMSHVLRDIVSVAEETFPKSIHIERHIPANLCLVKGDPAQIHQALLNLCINARDAMPRGGTLRVAIADRRLDEKEAASLPGSRAGEWLVVEISDTGTGIAPEVLTHVWDPFFTTKDAGKGTGLGLSSVRRIVALHDGFVTLDTQLGKGTTFRVFLPATAEILAKKGAKPVSAPPWGENELILVVEDDTVVREDISTILSRHSYRVISACDGVEAVEQFAARSVEFALVVFDVDMPHMGGATLARILGQLRPDLRLLAISGLPYDDKNGSQLEAARNLTHSFLLKPFTAEVLLKTVHSLVHASVKP